MRTIPFVIVVVMGFLAFPLATGQTYEDASVALERARHDVAEMAEAGFSTARVSDLLAAAEQLFEAQAALEETTGEADYTDVIEQADEIRLLKKQAFDVHDELEILRERIAMLDVSNASRIEMLLAEAEQEFTDERYDESLEKIEQAYAAISEQEALSVKIIAFFDASRKNIAAFLVDNLHLITAGFAAFLLLTLFFKNELSRKLIRRRIKNLEMEKKVINGLRKDLQHSYFEQGKVPEVTYKAKIKKYEELLRDIDRQIPLLRAELEEKHRGIFKKLTEKRPAKGQGEM